MPSHRFGKNRPSSSLFPNINTAFTTPPRCFSGETVYPATFVHSRFTTGPGQYTGTEAYSHEGKAKMRRCEKLAAPGLSHCSDCSEGELECIHDNIHSVRGLVVV